MPDSMFEKVAVGRIMQLSPGSLARRTYGKDFQRILKEKQKYYYQHRHDLPKAIAEKYIPSYNKNDWENPVDVYETKPESGFIGIASEGAVGLNPGYISNEPKSRAKDLIKDTLQHEFSHVLSYKRRQFPGAKYLNKTSPLIFGQKFKNMVGKTISTSRQKGYKALIGNPDEISAYMTPIVRRFYEQKGRAISSPADVRESLNMEKERIKEFYKTNPQQREGNLGIVEGLGNLDYIESLGQMLVKNKVKKKLKEMA